MSDDSGDKHVRGKRVKPNFCTECPEKGSCDCENNYRSPCRSHMTAWSNEVAACLTTAHAAQLSASKTFSANMKNAWKYLKQVGSDNPRVTKWGGQAHHSLCVVAVNNAVTDNTAMTWALPQIEWCINTEPNMIALPVWPMTINWYAAFSKLPGESTVSHQWREQDAVKPPPFKNLGQHDYDHGLYNEEVEARLRQKTKSVRSKIKDHEITAPAELKGILDAERIYWKDKVCKGPRATHNAWFAGKNDDDKNWWKEFSMVGPLGKGVQRAFPSPKDPNWATSFEKLVEAYTTLG